MVTTVADEIVNALSICILLWKDATPHSKFPRDIAEPVRIELPRVLVSKMPSHVLRKLGHEWASRVSAMDPWDVDPPSLFAEYVRKVSDDPLAVDMVMDVLKHESYRDSVLSMIKYAHRAPSAPSDCSALADIVRRVSVAVGHEPSDIAELSRCIKQRYDAIHSEVMQL